MGPLVDTVARIVAAWLLTYAVHSTALLGVVLVLTWKLVRSDAWRDALWKAALVGGVVTATLQQVSGLQPLGGQWRVAVAARIEAPSTDVADAIDVAASLPASRVSPAGVSAGNVDATGDVAYAADAAFVTRSWLDVVRDISPTLLLAGAWLCIALFGLGRLAWHHVRLFRALRGREELVDAPMAASLIQLCRQAGVWRPVRLSVASCSGPLALGGSEICVPRRFLEQLDVDAQRSALAHELAHLARRDPAWHLLAGVLERVFFFQPLNRLARLRLREAAEHLADDWAVRHTAAPLALARCLSEVAGWVDRRAVRIPSGTMAMAEGGSPLLRRVERLLEDRAPLATPSLARRVVAATLLLCAVAAAMPGVSARPAQASIPIGPSVRRPSVERGTEAAPPAHRTETAVPVQEPAERISTPRALDSVDAGLRSTTRRGRSISSSSSAQPYCENATQRIELRRGEWLGLRTYAHGARIEGWDQQYAQVDARECAAARERLDEAQMVVTAVDGGHRIESRYDDPRKLSWNLDDPSSPRNPATFDYVIRVPRWAIIRNVEVFGSRLEIHGVTGDVHASAVNGPVIASGLGGSVNLSSANGAVELTLYGAPAGRIQLSSVSGGVELRVPATADATVTLHTESGDIKSDVFVAGGKRRTGVLGRGGHPVLLSSTYGSAQLTLTGRDANTVQDEHWSSERLPLTDSIRAAARSNAARYGGGANAAQVQRLVTAAKRMSEHEADLVAERATWALAQMSGPDVLAPLVSASTHTDWRVRAYAAWSLGEIQDERAADALLRALSDGHWRVRMTAAYGSGSLRDRRAIPLLVDLLQDARWQVRIAAVENLQKIDDRSALDAVRAAVDDQHPLVRDAAVQAVRELSMAARPR